MQRLDVVNLENMLRGKGSSYPTILQWLMNSEIHTQITLVQIESSKTANRIKSPIASSQIESFGA